jgi:hypothetical protein
MIGFTEIAQVNTNGLATALRGINAPSEAINVVQTEDGSFTVSIWTELVDMPHARATDAATGVPEYRQIQPTVRQRRSRSEIDTATAEVTLPTVSKGRRGRGETTPEVEAA